MIQGCSIELPFFFGQFLIDRIEFQFPDVPPTDPIMIYIMISPFVPDQESWTSFRKYSIFDSQYNRYHQVIIIQRGVGHFWSRTRRFVFLPEDCSFVNPLMRSEFGSLWFVWGELKFDWFQTIRNYWLHGSGFWVDIVRKTDYRRGIFHAFVAIEEMAGADRDCGSHLSDSETIPTRYGRATESSILASSGLCTGAWLSYLTSNSRNS